jgi:hypothetical protein
LEALIDASVRGLQSHDYSPEQLDRALRHVYGVDTRLIEDGTYYAAETEDGVTLTGCGGWQTQNALRRRQLLDPRRRPA